jgi:hypothetical protein
MLVDHTEAIEQLRLILKNWQEQVISEKIIENRLFWIKFK